MEEGCVPGIRRECRLHRRMTKTTINNASSRIPPTAPPTTAALFACLAAAAAACGTGAVLVAREVAPPDVLEAVMSAEVDESPDGDDRAAAEELAAVSEADVSDDSDAEG